MSQARFSYRHIHALAYPIILGSVAQTILQVSDTVFLGRVGVVELGASAIAGVFYITLAMVGTGLGIGAQILIARREGAGEHREAGRLFRHAFVLFAIIGILFMALNYLAAPALFRGIVQSGRVAAAAVEYLVFRGWGILFVMAATAFRSFYIGIAHTRLITSAAFLMAGLNVLLDYLFIFGHGGCEAMGIAGAGLASALAEAVASCYLWFFTARHPRFRQYLLFRRGGTDFKLLRDIVRLATPVVLQNLMSMGSYFLFFVFVESLGERPVAVSNLVRSTYMILMTPVSGFAAAANSLVSNLMGRHLAGEVPALLRKISLMSLGVTTAGCLVYVAFPEQVLFVTTNRHALVAAALPSYYVTCAASLLFSVALVLLHGVSGTGHTAGVLKIEVIGIAVYLAYVAACVYGFRTPVVTVWVAEVIYWFLIGLFSFAYLHGGRWKNIKL